MSGKIKKVWEARNQILEGIKNSVFPHQEVEAIASERLKICNECPHFDTKGDDCMVPGTQPCCKLCGCSMGLKARALSAKCDDNRWEAILSQEEEDDLNANRYDQI